LRVATMESPRGSIRLERVRLSVKKGTAPDVGSFVELKARLQPPLIQCPETSSDVQNKPCFTGVS
jgi:competence protein ComEC